ARPPPATAPAWWVRRCGYEEQVSHRTFGARGHGAAEIVTNECLRPGEAALLRRRHVRIPRLQRRAPVGGDRDAAGSIELNADVDAGVHETDVDGHWIIRRTCKTAVVEGDGELTVGCGEDLLLKRVTRGAGIVDLNR